MYSYIGLLMYLYCIAILKYKGPIGQGVIKNALSEDRFNTGTVLLIFVPIYKQAVYLNFPEI